MTDGVSGIFAHTKTIKRFLQPMIEQVWGGGVMCFEDVPLFLGQFFRATTPMPFSGRFHQYLVIFLL